MIERAPPPVLQCIIAQQYLPAVAGLWGGAQNPKRGHARLARLHDPAS